jgi:hypothetical protein
MLNATANTNRGEDDESRYREENPHQGPIFSFWMALKPLRIDDAYEADSGEKETNHSSDLTHIL